MKKITSLLLLSWFYLNICKNIALIYNIRRYWFETNFEYKFNNKVFVFY